MVNVCSVAQNDPRKIQILQIIQKIPSGGCGSGGGHNRTAVAAAVAAAAGFVWFGCWGQKFSGRFERFKTFSKILPKFYLKEGHI